MHVSGPSAHRLYLGAAAVYPFTRHPSLSHSLFTPRLKHVRRHRSFPPYHQWRNCLEQMEHPPRTPRATYVIRADPRFLGGRVVGGLLFNCTKFGQMTLRTVIKIIATRSHIPRSQCTKFDFGWGCPRPRWGSL